METYVRAREEEKARERGGWAGLATTNPLLEPFQLLFKSLQLAKVEGYNRNKWFNSTNYDNLD